MDALSEIEKKVPPKLRRNIDSFSRGVGAFCRGDQERKVKWEADLAADLSNIDLTRGEGVADAAESIAYFKQQFLEREVNPDNFRSFVVLWLTTFGLSIAVQLVLGEGGLLDKCSRLATDWSAMINFCSATYGHFYSYISFRYALYGVLIGNALLFTYRKAVMRFDDLIIARNLLARPMANLLVASMLSYAIARLVAEGLVQVKLLGVEIQRATDPYRFDNSGMLFLLGLFAAIASDNYLRRLIEAARRSAEQAFSE